ncbi:MAG TPA: gamma-glutamyl-phosphate reductase, partial [Gammaproteobacteria bacterium]|nr:gamma-glutamyl-phosphate reductase [Gammaproteobacteria bacterium]
MMGQSEYMRTVGVEARKASVEICRASTETKNGALLAIGEAILANRSALMSANEQDLESGRKNGLSEPMLDRLTFTDERFETMVAGLRQVAALNDPVG